MSFGSYTVEKFTEIEFQFSKITSGVQKQSYGEHMSLMYQKVLNTLSTENMLKKISRQKIRKR
jgi:hypothetical protein